MENKELMSVVEGMIFMVGEEGIDLVSLSKLLDEKREDVLQVLDHLVDEYRQEHHGIELVNYGGLYKFVSKGKIHPYGEKYFTITKPNQLSPAALETLAIIAYRQPITRVEIEEIRGVGSDAMLRRLIARGLIKEAGRADSVGLPFLYEVTDHFLDVFKLVSLEELPELPEFSEQMELDLYE